MKNKEIKVYAPTDNKQNFIEKTYEDKKDEQIKFDISFENNDAYFNEFDSELFFDITKK